MWSDRNGQHPLRDSKSQNKLILHLAKFLDLCDLWHKNNFKAKILLDYRLPTYPELAIQ